MVLKPGSFIGLVNYLKKDGSFNPAQYSEYSVWSIQLKEAFFYVTAIHVEFERAFFYGSLAYVICDRLFLN
ncbi:MAG: hypothetical protein WC595_02295 [Candidatus Nanoarchaeia archaeon]